MAEYALSCVIKSMSELLLYAVEHVPELKGRIEVIQMKLRQLQSILQIAVTRQEIDEGIRNWVAEIREVSYDIEDLLLVAICPRKEGNLLRSFTCMFKQGTSLHDLEPKIQDIYDKISALESDLRVRNIQPRQNGYLNPVSQKWLQRRRTYSQLVEEDFVGLDKDVALLVGRLVKVKEDVVVSITGMGGIGKTTIAKRIYHHADVRSYFHGFAWACISQQWQHEDVLQRILNKLEPEKKKEINEMKYDKLVEELYEVQKRKRCLIVLDDVWEMKLWDVLRPVFRMGQSNIKVLITTRKKEIRGYVNIDVRCYLYEQRYLNEMESWELLKKKVGFGLNMSCSSSEDDDDVASIAGSFHSCLTDEEDNDDDEATSQLDTLRSEDCIQDPRNQMEIERLGRQMVAQCGGLPLAIVVLGGLLITKATVTEWRTVHQNLNSYLRKGKNFRENGTVHEVLALSYHDLPYQLKPCFLHLGNFPEDFKIPTRKLYQLWSAEGFISQEGYEEDESIMDISERYLSELVQRCMVQVRVDDATGRFKSCQLHDLTRELCLVKGEENFLKKFPPRLEPEIIVPRSPSTMVSAACIARRFSITVDRDFDSYFPVRKDNSEHVRSALFFSRLSDRRNLQPALDFVCDEFKLLGVLDIERFDFGEKLSKEIGNLVYLRYLSLRGSRFYKLPASISNLKYLQTLDLRVPFFVSLIIPDVIWKLNLLKHLYLPTNHKCSKGKLQLGTLIQLETLKNFDTRVSDYKDLSNLTKLQKLAAILDLEFDNFEQFISNLKLKSQHIKDSSFRIRYDFRSEKELTVLKEVVGFSHLRKLDLVGFVDRLPGSGNFAQSLNKLTLRKNGLKEDALVTLEKLPNLYSLILRQNVFTVKEICCTTRGFPQLRSFELQGLSSLECWTIEEGAMPNLYCLKIDECENLKMLPEGIKFIGTLKELVIANMPNAFKRRIQNVEGEGGDDRYKAEHVSSITVVETNSSPMAHLGKQLSGNSYSGLFQSFSPSLVPKVWQNS